MTHPTETPPDIESLARLNESFETRTPEEILEYAFNEYSSKIILACSFGAEDVVLADMIFRQHPHATLFYLDTDFLFPETLEVRDRIIERYRLKPEQVIQMKSLNDPGRSGGKIRRSIVDDATRPMLPSSKN